MSIEVLPTTAPSGARRAAPISARFRAALVRAAALLLMLIAAFPAEARVDNLLNRGIDALISTARDLHDEGPRFQLNLRADYLGMDGYSRAREMARERPYASSNMDNLDLNDNMGLSSMLLYEVGTDLRIGYRNHFTFNYLWGRTEGEGYTGYKTGFNDHYYFDPGETMSQLNLDSFQVGWYYRLLDNGEYKLDLGAGAMNLRAEISYANDDDDHYETEVIFAPLMPYLTASGEWRPGKNIVLGSDVKVALNGIKSKELTELPADGRYVSVNLYGKYPLTDYFALTGGINYSNVMVAFDGIETNDHTGYDHQADNKLDMEMLGGYVGFAMQDPQASVVAFFRNLLR